MSRPTENPQQLPYGGAPPGTGLPSGGPQTGAPTGGRRSRRKSKGGGILQATSMGGRRRRSRGRRSRRSRRSMRGGELYGFGGGPYVGGPDPALADGNVRVGGLADGQEVEPLSASAKNDPKLFSGGRRSRKASRKAPRKSGKSSGKRSPWLEHVMSVKAANPTFSLGDAMKAAKKTYKK